MKRFPSPRCASAIRCEKLKGLLTYFPPVPTAVPPHFAFVLGVVLWTVYRPVQLWIIALYFARAFLPGAFSQRIIAGLAFISYVTAGFFFRFVPEAFGS